MSTGSSPITFRASAELRRIIWYCGLGLIVLVTMGIIMDPWLPPASDRIATGIGIMIVLVVLLTIGTLAVYRYRLVLDDAGIHRRRLIGWDHWPWSDFQNGCIDQTETGAFINRNRALIKRSLSWLLLSPSDAAIVRRACLAHWRPAPVSLPPSLTIWIGPWRRANVTPEGLTLRGHSVSRRQTWPWSQLQHAAIYTRFNGDRVCRKVRLAFPGRRWVIDVPKIRCNQYSLPIALRQYVPPDRIIEVPLAEPPIPGAAARRALSQITLHLRHNRILMRRLLKLLVLAGVAALVFLGIATLPSTFFGTWLAWPMTIAILAAVSSIYLLLLIWTTRRLHRSFLARRMQIVEIVCE